VDRGAGGGRRCMAHQTLELACTEFAELAG